MALLISVTPCVLASGPVIGLAISQGNLEVDRASVAGNANLNDGAELKTGKDSARIQLSNGGRATLGANSQGKVYAGSLALERGEGLVASPNAYTLQAKGMTVAPGSRDAVAHVAVKGNAIWVSAINGPVKVVGANGIVMARVEAGKGLSFEPGASSVSTMTGQLRNENGQFRLKDEISNLDVVVTGTGLARSIGKRVQVTGAAKATADGESQIITLAKLNTLENDNSGGGQSGKGSGRAARAGLSTGAKIGIIAGIAAGATVGIVLANIS